VLIEVIESRIKTYVDEEMVVVVVQEKSRLNLKIRLGGDYKPWE